MNFITQRVASRAVRGTTKSLLSANILRTNVVGIKRFQSSVTTPPLGKDVPLQEDGYPYVKPELYYYRDPDAKWDDPQNRRNVGELLNPDDDILNLWAPTYYDTVSDSTAVSFQLIFFAGVGVFSAFMYFFFYPERRAVPREYPDGLARDFGAKNDDEAALYGMRVDKTY
ncbi:uncharacterized protein CYBJADRAFT_189217 [Cyberlindnera jadinii NRRL Y-1542]|uniref:Uncharacterized protein n=1 Tax=Cyberlindnera jadinii (strain ATCC 18201 / CBS 1600 / BCRC 20928 / JCM 3617 / NBRC 0987 / NRRL Y-1542) TaxID=983966 RepID=A0A1E4S6D0_CYBJN|nr:hypothetical protein CYBJADRAFT_189217 [Cyberlindnera jadinii NRRL Y-1542]ODV75071.1 hypothetical protein CYBJADRAFT_189217 [Cyberlindnera jadinii NRRL Y-1542]